MNPTIVAIHKRSNHGPTFAELAFTPKVKEQQQLHDSRQQYERVEQAGRPTANWSHKNKRLLGSATNSTWHCQRNGMAIHPISRRGQRVSDHLTITPWDLRICEETNST